MGIYKVKLRIFISVLIVIFVTMIGVSALAPGISKTISVVLNKVTVNIDGKAVRGDNIYYNNEIYIKANKISEVLNGGYSYDSNKNIIEITTKQGELTQLNNAYQELAKINSLKEVNYREKIVILTISARLHEISQGFNMSGIIANSGYEKKDSYIYKTYYEMFKVNKGSFLDNRQFYLDVANNTISTSSNEKNITATKNLLTMINKLDEIINLQTDLYAVYDANKYMKMSDNMLNITIMNTSNHMELFSDTYKLNKPYQEQGGDMAQ